MKANLSLMTGIFIITLPFVESCKTEKSTSENKGDINSSSPSFNGSVYALCKAQESLQAPGTKTPESEDQAFKRANQTSPGFFDDMNACEVTDIASIENKRKELEKLEGQGPSRIKAEVVGGNCEWRDPQSLTNKNGENLEASDEFSKMQLLLSCHFHTAPEFLSKESHKEIFNQVANPSDDKIDGELHCIFPSETKTRPTVFGLHVRCLEAGENHKEGKQCSSEILGLYRQCQDTNYGCCNNGSLTKPYHHQSAEEKAISPDFRICKSVVVDVDCSLLSGMHGHTSAAVDVGPEYEGKFLPASPGHRRLNRGPERIEFRN